jgi:hypothetical protein
MYCGDGVCNNGETCSSCSGDCGKCYIPSGGGSSGGGSSGGSSGGGGGGGTGGGSAILPKDARYKNITLDYTEFNLIENENYKIYVEQNTNNFSYSFYSNYYGELCFNEECIQIKPFELHEINSSEELTFEFKKQKIEYAQKLNISVQNKFLDKNKIKFYLDEFNDSRTLENKCASFLGYHISPCVDKQSCLFACRSIPLCSGMSNSEIFLDFSKFVYINRMELNQLYLDCYALETENISEYKKCIMEIYGKAKEIESSPLFGTCPTCLGVCEETNYSYNSLDKILILLNDYEKVISSNVTADISEYNDEADKLNSLLEKNNKINEKVSYSKKEVQDLIYMHNDYEIISEQEIKLINNEIEEILKNITLYNQMNCTSNYERFLSLNHFNGELTSCLMSAEIEHINSSSCEGCKEPDFLFIIISCIIIIVLFFLYKKLKL